MNLTRATKWCWMVVTVTTGLVWAGEPAGHPSRLTADKLPETVDSIQCECCNCLVETIDEGEVSYYRYGDPGFLGLTAVIHNPRSWAGFWQQHTAGNIPPPPLPRVDFRRWTVLVAIQGTQSSSCGPFIKIAGVHHCGADAVVRIIDDETPGPCDALSNPFHIVKVPIRCVGPFASVFFASHVPGAVPGAMAGYVLNAAGTGVIEPIAGALVQLIRPDPDGADPNSDEVVAQTRTNNAGFYRLGDIPAGLYLARVSAEGFEPIAERVEIFPGRITERNFSLRPIVEPSGGIVGEVRGGSSWDESVPLPGVHILLFDGPAPDDVSTPPIAETETDCEGHFRFFDLDPGEYHLIALAPGFIPETADAVIEPGEVAMVRFLMHTE
ncbi:MAG: carboxypeptidase-like regulatory domain-containing protein [Phycisphaerae bacterium]